MVDVVVLIAFIIAHLTTIGRTEIRITSNLVANAVAKAAADRAIFLAIFNQSDPQREQHRPVDADARANWRSATTERFPGSTTTPGGSFRTRLLPVLLGALLCATGSDPVPVRVDPQLRAGSPSCPVCLH
jgi:hypothetical protein